MNWEALSAIGQLVGAIAVVISLVYLASAVRSNTRATREASMRWLSDNYTQWIRHISGNPDLSELYYRGIHDFESLKGAELVRFTALMVEAFRRSEEMYYLQLEGRGAICVEGDSSGHARLEHISWNSSLVAFSLPLVQWGFCEAH